MLVSRKASEHLQLSMCGILRDGIVGVNALRCPIHHLIIYIGNEPTTNPLLEKKKNSLWDRKMSQFL